MYGKEEAVDGEQQIKTEENDEINGGVDKEVISNAVDSGKDSNKRKLLRGRQWTRKVMISEMIKRKVTSGKTTMKTRVMKKMAETTTATTTSI